MQICYNIFVSCWYTYTTLYELINETYERLNQINFIYLLVERSAT